MDARRLRGQDWFAALFGALLFGSLFLDWYAHPEVSTIDGAGGSLSLSGTSAWEAFAVTDVAIAVAALMGVGVGLLTAIHSTTSIPIVWTTFSSIVTGIVAIWLTVRTLNPPGSDVPRELGAVIAPTLAWLLTISCWGAMRNDRPGAAPRREPEIERLPAPPATG